jgi:hypothetical protein
MLVWNETGRIRDQSGILRRIRSCERQQHRTRQRRAAPLARRTQDWVARSHHDVTPASSRVQHREQIRRAWRPRRVPKVRGRPAGPASLARDVLRVTGGDPLRDVAEVEQ